MVPSLCDTATRIKDGLERGGGGGGGGADVEGCIEPFRGAWARQSRGLRGRWGWLERKNGLGRVAGFALRSGFCAAIAHRVVHIPGSTLLGRRTDFGIFDLAVFRPFEQTIF